MSILFKESLVSLVSLGQRIFFDLLCVGVWLLIHTTRASLHMVPCAANGRILVILVTSVTNPLTGIIANISKYHHDD